MRIRAIHLGASLLAFTTLASASDDPVLAAVFARDVELQAASGRGDREAYRAGLSRDYVYIDCARQDASQPALFSAAAPLVDLSDRSWIYHIVLVASGRRGARYL